MVKDDHTLRSRHLPWSVGSRMQPMRCFRVSVRLVLCFHHTARCQKPSAHWGPVVSMWVDYDTMIRYNVGLTICKPSSAHLGFCQNQKVDGSQLLLVKSCSFVFRCKWFGTAGLQAAQCTVYFKLAQHSRPVQRVHAKVKVDIPTIFSRTEKGRLVQHNGGNAARKGRQLATHAVAHVAIEYA